MQIVANERIGDRQGRPVDVIDNAGHDQHCERRPLDRFDPRGRRHRLRYRHFIAPYCPLGSIAPTKNTQSTLRSMRPANAFLLAQTQALLCLGSSNRRPVSTMLSWESPSGAAEYFSL